MKPEMKSACLKAGAKLAIGFSLLAAVIGIRMVTATPVGIESGIEELERLDVQIASESSSTNSRTPDAAPAADDSIAARLSADIREHMPSFDSRSDDGDKLVSCRLGGSTRFMRADDCAMRGGASTVVSHDR